MKIVIDIPNDHKRVIDNLVTDGKGYLLPHEVEDTLAKAVKIGVPLPKEHGRLGDLSKIYVELNEAQVEGTEEYKGLGEAKQIICNAPTIIEKE